MGLGRRVIKLKRKITAHAVGRIEERLGIGKGKHKKSEFKKAIDKGLNPSQFKGKFRDHLSSKVQRGLQVKVYGGNVWLYKKSLSSYKLVTVYPVDEKYLIYLDKDVIREKIVKLNTRRTQLPSYKNQLRTLVNELDSEVFRILLPLLETEIDRLIKENEEEIKNT